MLFQPLLLLILLHQADKVRHLRHNQIQQMHMQAQYEQNVLQYNTWKNTQLMQTLETYRQLQTDRNSAESRISELERVIKNSTMYAPISGRITEVKKMNCGD